MNFSFTDKVGRNLTETSCEAEQSVRRRDWSSLTANRGCINLTVVIGLALTLGLLYAPALNAFFISDDFATVAYLHFTKSLLNGEGLLGFLFRSNDGGRYFRAIGQLMYWTDSLMWGLQPFGYHLTNLAFHSLSTFLVFLLAGVLGQDRVLAFAATLLFAVMPVHAEAVSWIAARYDVICAVFFIAGVLFFVLYRRKGRLSLYLLSLVTFLLALASKEIALTFPPTILAYDLIYHGKASDKPADLLKRHLPFWIVLSLFLSVRWMVLGQIGYSGLGLGVEGFFFWLDGLLRATFDPFIREVDPGTRWILLAAVALILWLYRSRREVVFGLVWIPITYAATVNSITGPSDRSFYIPSLGLALAIASVSSRPMHRTVSALRGLGMTALFLLVVSYGATLVVRNQYYYRAGEIAQAIPQQVKSVHPTLPLDARLVFVGVPDQIAEGPLVYITGLPAALQISYQNPRLEVNKFTRFPIWLDKLDRTFFFEVDHRRVAERADLVHALEERNRCANSWRLAMEWLFSGNTQGWEPWNQLTGFALRDGVLVAQSEGSDPQMASPPINISTMEIGEIQVTMLVRATASKLQGAVYWLVDGQQDFSPAFQASFPLQADGEFHTYRVDVGESGMLLIGDRIVQLRLDPMDAPGEMAIRSIQINLRCSEIEGTRCVCPP